MVRANLKLLLAIPAIGWAACGAYLAFGDYGIQGHLADLKWLAVGGVLALVSLVVGLFEPTRRPALASFLVVAAAGIGQPMFRRHRLAGGVRQLEAIYQDMAARGRPFPPSIDKASFDGPEFLPWYYQRNPDGSFAIVYIVSSDGYAMEYPKGRWRWIGYRPDGYGAYDETPSG